MHVLKAVTNAGRTCGATSVGVLKGNKIQISNHPDRRFYQFLGVRNLRKAMYVTRAIKRIWANRVPKYTPDFWSQLATVNSGFYTVPKTV